MTEAGGTTTLNQVANVGSYTLWKISNSSVSEGETITLPAACPITAGVQVCIVGALEETAESQLGSVLSISYSETNTQFTADVVVGAATFTDKAVDILFYAMQ